MNAALAYTPAEPLPVPAPFAASYADCTKESVGAGQPPGVEPSCTTITFLSVSTTTSANAPVNALDCVVLPRLNLSCVAMCFSFKLRYFIIYDRTPKSNIS